MKLTHGFGGTVKINTTDGNIMLNISHCFVQSKKAQSVLYLFVKGLFLFPVAGL